MKRLHKLLALNKRARKHGVSPQWFTAENWSIRYLAAESDSEKVKLREELAKKKLSVHEIIFLCEAFVRLDQGVIEILSVKEYDHTPDNGDILEALREQDVLDYLSDFREAFQGKNREREKK